MAEIKFTHSRNTLNEGRQINMGFAFLKRTGENQYEDVHPLSPCKDYLNDIVWAEAIKKPVSAYGLRYKPQGIFKTGAAYIAVSICDYSEHSTLESYTWSEYPKTVKMLQDNYKTLEGFMRHFEELLEVDGRTTIEQVGDNMYLVTVPLFWTRFMFSISLYSLLLRVGQYYTEGDPVEFLKSNKYYTPDVYLVNSVLGRLDSIIKHKDKVTQDLTQYHGGTDVHNSGVVESKLCFPENDD